MIFVTYFIFLVVYGMASKKNRVHKNVLEPTPVLYILKADILFAFIESFWNIIVGLYGISSVTHQVNFIFQKVMPYYLTFYINKIKLALSIL